MCHWYKYNKSTKSENTNVKNGADSFSSHKDTKNQTSIKTHEFGSCS